MRTLNIGLIAIALTIAPAVAVAQQPDPHVHQHPASPPAQEHAGHDMGAMSLFDAREASGTAWLPEATPMYGVQTDAGAWSLMFHGNAFAQFLNEGGARGDQQAGSVNWIMGMARRPAGAGRIGLRAMFSLEPWTIRGCGYPDLLASGESCRGETIHDRQHPHDAFMELAAEYQQPLRGAVQWQVYGGLAGEPALGPVAYPHRVSSMPNPLAPIGHHWLDATHISFGVVTAGVFSRTWKVEGSLFNGREPDEKRTNLELAPLDSYSGRVWYLPSAHWALQVSAGHLSEAEAGHLGAERVDVDRLTASATYQRTFGSDWQWASTIAGGRNEEAGQSTRALLIESSLALRDRDTWFGRLEWAGKAAHDLDIHGSTSVFTVAKLQLGYTAYFRSWRNLTPGFGASLSLSMVPAALEPSYGHPAIRGAALFFALRPAAHHHQR